MDHIECDKRKMNYIHNPSCFTDIICLAVGFVCSSKRMENTWWITDYQQVQKLYESLNQVKIKTVKRMKISLSIT